MKRFISLILLAALISQVSMAPQFITFENGKLGVNFGGYHAGVGIGGLLGGKGTSGGLYAEAGTPHGQSARAGLGGSVDENGGASGGLFAGATAGGNVKASAGLGGEVNAEKSAGGGFASAQAGDRFASSGLAGETTVEGSSGVLLSANNDQVLEVKPVNKNIQASFNIDAANEVVPLHNVESETSVDIKPPVIIKEVSKAWIPNSYYYRKPIYPTFNFQDIMNSVFEARPRGYSSRRSWMMPQRNYNPRVYKVYQEPPPQIVEKHIAHAHYKPRRPHFRKTAFVGGYIGGDGEIVPPAGHNLEPAIEKRIDVGAEANANAGASVGIEANGDVGHTYTKQVTYQRNPSFFQDIFNIPISTLRAVGNFLSNTAANTNVSVQKSASVQAESDSIPSKHDTSSVSSSSAQITVETPSASKFIDDIFAIPINTLGAVNSFLQNNVPARKNIQVSHEDGATPVRLGPHARRRRNKQIVVFQEAGEKSNP